MKTYLRHRILNVVDVKELIALEYLDFEGKYSEYAETHDFWEICYVQCGEIELSLSGKKHPVSQGQVILIPPDKKHSYSSATGNASKAFVICFESFSHALKPLGERCFSLDCALLDCMSKIISECALTFRMNENELLEVLPSPAFGGQQAIILLIEYFLICLLRRLSTEKNAGIVFLSGEKFYADLVDVVIRFFRDNLHEKLSLDDICNKFNYSRSFICKTFKQQTGETLFSCFTRLKLEEARRLLEQTDMTVTKIAATLGFKETKYFDALFKKHTGMSPLAYRKNIKER
ncbi:MAG: helix-turn-helix transcriptional regulator [Clostridia bacterium]|nr:helix-turn-helix transcriptional regulator [Clostridia bacterium]